MKPVNEKLELTEKQLLERVGTRDTHAFGVLYDKFRPKVYTYALKISGSVEVAEDIVHDVFLKVWQYQEPQKIANLEAFLRVVTRNFTLKWVRRNVLERAVSTEMKYTWNEAESATEQAVNLKEIEEILDQAIALLPPKRRLIFQLCKHEGLKYDEVAERTNLSRLTVKTHMQLALRFLRDYMAKHHDVVVVLLAFSLG